MRRKMEEQMSATDPSVQFFPERAFDFDGLDTVVITQSMDSTTGGMVWDAEVVLAATRRTTANEELILRIRLHAGGRHAVEAPLTAHKGETNKTRQSAVRSS